MAYSLSWLRSRRRKRPSAVWGVDAAERFFERLVTSLGFQIFLNAMGTPRRCSVTAFASAGMCDSSLDKTRACSVA
jgi:hypothetical protein